MKNYLNTLFLYRKKFLKTGFNGKLFYNKENSTSNKQDEKKKRKREFGNLGTQIFFNPPYSNIMETNVGKLFLKLVKQHTSLKNIIA